MRPTIQVIDERLAARIVDEAMQVLAEIGIEVRGSELRRRLLDAGLTLDDKGERLLFPQALVEQAIADAPSEFDLYDRDGSLYTTLGGNKVHFVPASSGLKVLDHRNGKVRPPNTADFVE